MLYPLFLFQVKKVICNTFTVQLHVFVGKVHLALCTCKIYGSVRDFLHFLIVFCKSIHVLCCPVIVTAEGSHKARGYFSVALADKLFKMVFFYYGIKHCFVVVKADSAENVGISAFCNLNVCHMLTS